LGAGRRTAWSFTRLKGRYSVKSKRKKGNVIKTRVTDPSLDSVRFKAGRKGT
jgi:hypothetical protein